MSETPGPSWGSALARGLAVGALLAAISIAGHSLSQSSVHARDEMPILELPRDVVLVPLAVLIGLAVSLLARRRGPSPAPEAHPVRLGVARGLVAGLLLAIADAFIEGVVGPLAWNWGGLHASYLVRPAVSGLIWGLTAGVMAPLEVAFPTRPRSPVAFACVLGGSSAIALVGLLVAFLQASYTGAISQTGSPLQALSVVRQNMEPETLEYCLRLVPPFALFTLVRRFGRGLVEETLLVTLASSVFAIGYLQGKGYSTGGAFLGSIVDIFVIASVLPLAAEVAERLERRGRQQPD